MQVNTLITSFAEFNGGSDDVVHERQQKRLTEKLGNY